MTLRHNDRCAGDAHDTKPRLRDDVRILPSAALTVTLIALVAFVVQYPRAAMWAVVVALVLAVLALFTLAIEAGREKDRADDAEKRAGDLADKLAATEAERDIATDLLARYKADATPVPLLRVVPAQRDPEHDRLAMSAEEWAAIERETREL